MRDHVASLRPMQWLKNLLVFAAPLAAGLPIEDLSWLRLVLAALAFVAMSSSVYLLNDLLDLEVDRRHPTKMHRPLASGRVTVRTTRLMACGMLIVAVVLAAWSSTGTLLTLLAYAVINVIYSLGGKNIPWLEIVAVASGFVLRPLAGSYATDISPSMAFLLAFGAGAIMVATGKRLAELTHNADRVRPVLHQYSAQSLRGAMYLAAGILAVTYLGWLIAGISTDSRATTLANAGSLVCVLTAVSRYLRVSVSALAESPERLVLRDRPLRLVAILWFVFLLVAALAG
jgi:decaprenyl-phosphate phosphoribosyltransferase